MDENYFRTEQERRVMLTEKEQEKVIGINPAFTSISEAAYFDNYDLPCPVRVRVKDRNGEDTVLVVRRSRHGSVKTEVEVLRALNAYGLPVPKVLAEPFITKGGEYTAVYSFLHGENLQKISMKLEGDLARARDLLVKAVSTLIGATAFLRTHGVSRLMPEITLTLELRVIDTQENPWQKEKLVRTAIKKLQKVLPGVQTPLVFSNGDYQPGNFLAQGEAITGYLDFESPSFQDPLMGFVKYPIYDLYPLSRTNMIALFLKKQRFSERDFAPRLALGCLKVLQKEIPVQGGTDATRRYRDHVLALLGESLSSLRVSSLQH